MATALLSSPELTTAIKALRAVADKGDDLMRPSARAENPETAALGRLPIPHELDNNTLTKTIRGTLLLSSDGTMAAVPNYSAVQDRSGENFFRIGTARRARVGHVASTDFDAKIIDFDAGNQ